MEKKKIAVIGAGNWGSAIIKVIAENTKKHDDLFEKMVTVWIHREEYNGKTITEYINETHTNPKYLPGIQLPDNIFATEDLIEVTKISDIIVFSTPHQFLPNILKNMKGHFKKGAIGLSLAKGFAQKDKSSLDMVSDSIRAEGIKVAVLMGANVANDVAKMEFCESTVGTDDDADGQILQKLLDRDYFQVQRSTDPFGVELCGALKNIVAVAAGFAEGMGLGTNTLSAIIRIGLIEMIEFGKYFSKKRQCSEPEIETYFKSCGLADLITTCFGGRNRKIAAIYVEAKEKGDSIDKLEAIHLNGQKLQGPLTSAEVYNYLKSIDPDVLVKFPLFNFVYETCYGDKSPKDLIKVLESTRCLRD